MQYIMMPLNVFKMGSLLGTECLWKGIAVVYESSSAHPIHNWFWRQPVAKLTMWHFNKHKYTKHAQILSKVIIDWLHLLYNFWVGNVIWVHL